MKIKIVNNGKHPLPHHQTDLSAGVDLYANIDQPITLQPLERVLVSTGICIQLPAGFEAQVRPRSGLALKHGISLVNTPGTIDADYRGEVRVIAVNLSNVPYTINDGERIAQMVVAKHERLEWELAESLDDSERGHNGFGHTGE